MEKSALYEFTIEPGEQKEVVLRIKRENRGLIRGVVVDECGRMVKDASVKLFEVEKKKDKHTELCPVSHTFTDEFGQFLFGPLCPEKCYAIKVWVNSTCMSKDYAEICEDRECLKPYRCKKFPKAEEEGISTFEEQFADVEELIEE